MPYTWSEWHRLSVMMVDDFEPSGPAGRLLVRRLRRGRAFLKPPVRPFRRVPVRALVSHRWSESK